MWTTPSGTLTPVRALTVNSAQQLVFDPTGNNYILDATTTSNVIDLGHSTNTENYLRLYRNKGSAMAAGDIMWGLNFRGSTTTGLTPTGLTTGAMFLGRADGTWSGSSAPGAFDWYTNPSGSIGLGLAMTLDAAKKLKVYGDLEVVGSISSSGSGGALTVTDFTSYPTIGGGFGRDSVIGVAGFPIWQLYRINGTVGSPTVVLSGDLVGVLGFGGQYDTTVGHTYNAAGITGVAVENYASGARGTKLNVAVTQAGASSTTTSATFNADLSFNVVGDLTVATNKLTVAAASGNTAVAGTLGVTGASTLTDLTVSPTVGGGFGRAILQGVAGYPIWQFYRINGTAGSPTKIVSGNPTGILGFGGQYDTTVGHVSNAAYIGGLATEDWSSTAHGEKLELYTVANTTTTQVLAATFDQDQSLTIAGDFTANSLNHSVAVRAGWVNETLTWTRVSNTQFTISSATDLTARYAKGTKLKWSESSVVKFGVVSSSSFASSTTTVNLIPTSDYLMVATADASSTFFSYAASPQQFPAWFNWIPTHTGWSVAANAAANPGQQVITTVSTTIATSLFNKTAHGLADGTAITLAGVSNTTGVSNNTVYYVVSTAANTFKVATTPGGTAVTLGGTSDASLSVTQLGIYRWSSPGGNTLHLVVRHSANGVSTNASHTISLPVTCATITNQVWGGVFAATDNNTRQVGEWSITSAGANLVVNGIQATVTNTASGNSRVIYIFAVYEF